MGDTRYLGTPRDKGDTLKMPTLNALIGTTNPRTGTVCGREIHVGLSGLWQWARKAGLTLFPCAVSDCRMLRRGRCGYGCQAGCQ